MEFINDKNAPPPHGPYSHAVRSGNTLYLSGQVPYDNNGTLIGTNIAEQTEQTIKNMKSLLASAGLGMSNIVKTTIFLADWNDFSEFNTVYAKFMSNHKPARVTVQAGGLVPGCLLEMEAIAEFPE